MQPLILANVSFKAANILIGNEQGEGVHNFRVAEWAHCATSQPIFLTFDSDLQVQIIWKKTEIWNASYFNNHMHLEHFCKCVNYKVSKFYSYLNLGFCDLCTFQLQFYFSCIQYYSLFQMRFFPSVSCRLLSVTWCLFIFLSGTAVSGRLYDMTCAQGWKLTCHLQSEKMILEFGFKPGNFL